MDGTHPLITGVISLQNVLVDRMFRHVRDLCPVMGSNISESGSDSELNSKCKNDHHQRCTQWSLGGGQPNATNDTSVDESSVEKVALPQRSARRKRSAPDCYLCDHQITGKYSGIERQNEQPATSGEPVSAIQILFVLSAPHKCLGKLCL